MFATIPESKHQNTAKRRLTQAALTVYLTIGSIHAMEVKLKWNANSEPDIAGYVVHYGTASGKLDQLHYTENVTATTLSGLEPSTTYYLALQAYNSSGLFSDLTTEIIHTTQSASFLGLTIRDEAGNLLSNDGHVLDLGQVRLGAVGVERVLTLSNDGPEAISGLRWIIEDAGARNFIIEGMPVVALANTNSSFENAFNGWASQGQLRTRASETASHGNHLVEFSHGEGPNDGVLQTSFPTTPGNSYRLEFDLGVLSYNTSLQRLSTNLYGQGILLSEILTIRGIGAGQTVWEPKSYEFTADSEVTTLRFADASETTSAIDLHLDHVRVIDQSASSGGGGLALAAGSSTTIGIRFQPTSEGGRGAKLRLMRDGAREDAYHFELQAGGVMGYDHWLALRIAANMAGEGGENPLLDYAFGLQPDETTERPLSYLNGSVISRGKPTVLVPAQTGGDFRGVFVRRKDREIAGVVYRPQFSSNLLTWHDADGLPAILADDGEVEIVSLPGPGALDGKPARFFRLGILLATDT
ncbi:MAG: fibronectin type III domain-containing protein [Luteolibacter sp.]